MPSGQTSERAEPGREAALVQARQRAVGALFHMIQDSFAHGHVDRDAAGPHPGKI